MDMKRYLIRLTAVSILSAWIRRMAPSGGAGRAARLGAGILVLLTAFGPIAQADTLLAAEHLVRYGYGDVLAAEGFAAETNNLLSALISQEAEAYILDKAAETGLSLEVSVQTEVVDSCPVPWRVTISGSFTEHQRTALSRMIAEDLDIPEERQEWWSM